MAQRTPTTSRTNGRRAGGSTTRDGRTRSTTANPRLDLSGPEIQRFGSLRQLPIGLPDKAKAKSCEVLNEILADTTNFKRTFIRSQTGLRLPLLRRLTATAQLNADYDNAPAPGKAKSDRVYLLTLGYHW